MTNTLDDAVKMIAHNINPLYPYFSIPCYDAHSFTKVCESYKTRYTTTEQTVDNAFYNLKVKNFRDTEVYVRNILAITYYDNVMKRYSITIILLVAELS